MSNSSPACYQAIEVKYLNATARSGVRIKATCAAKSITRGRDYDHSITGDALQVATELAQSLDWLDNSPGYHLILGSLKNGNYVAVLQARAGE